MFCTTRDFAPVYSVTVWAFEQKDHNLFLAANADVEFTTDSGFGPYGAIEGVSDLVRYSYYFNVAGSVGDAVLLLMLADLFESEPIVRRLYRNTPNQDTLPSGHYYTPTMLHFASGTATAEDELIQKLRIHFGRGGRAALDARASQNERQYAAGVRSASFWDGHGSTMGPRVCNALRTTKPKNLSVALTGGDAVLSWNAPADASLSGYRILRGVGGATPAVYVGDTATTDTTWTDDGLEPGDYDWSVQALYDSYPSRESNAVGGTVEDVLRVEAPTTFVSTEGDTAVATLSATGTDTAASELTWSISGGADSTHFTLNSSGVRGRKRLRGGRRRRRRRDL